MFQYRAHIPPEAFVLGYHVSPEEFLESLELPLQAPPYLRQRQAVIPTY